MTPDEILRLFETIARTGLMENIVSKTITMKQGEDDRQITVRMVYRPRD